VLRFANKSRAAGENFSSDYFLERATAFENCDFTCAFDAKREAIAWHS